MEKVADLLAHKPSRFNYVSSACLVSDALYQMTCENIDHLVVLEADHFQGIITHYDVASKILSEHRPLNKIKVVEFMNHTLPSVTSDASLQSCMKQMEQHNVRHLVVFDQFDFKGVVSAYDLMQEALHRRDPIASEEETPRRGHFWNH